MLVVLLVQPEPERRRALAAVLRDSGYAVAVAADPAGVPAGLAPDAVVLAGAEGSSVGGAAVVRDEGDDEAVRAALAELAVVRSPLLALSSSRVDLRTRTVLRDAGPVTLTEKEAALLAWLAARPGRTVDRGELLVHVWGYRAEMITRTVDVTVRRLREKIERDPSAPEHLVSVRGEGYRLDLPEAAPAPSPDGPIGRDDDLRALDAAIRLSSLVTVLGPPGIGKTTLARALCARSGARFADASSARGADDLLLVVAAALGVPPQGASVAGLRAALVARDGLVLVIDNVEQVADAAAEALSAWIATPARFVVTSRTRLRLDGERVLDLGPLAPDAAAELLLRRAGERAGGWGRDAPEVVAEVVAALEGVPLALELAAARARMMTPAVLRDRLRGSLAWLTDDRRGREDRQRTLEGALRWSWDLLADDERRALSQLALFRDGCELDAAEAVLDVPDPLGAVQSLVDHSLVRLDPDGRLRPYVAVAELVGRIAPSDATGRHASYYAGFAARLAEQADGPDGFDAAAAIRRDHDNLLAALDVAGPVEVEALADALHRPWELDGIPPGDLARLVAAADRTGHPIVSMVAVQMLVAHGRIAEAATRLDRLPVATALDRMRAGLARGIVASRTGRDAADRAFGAALAEPVDAPLLRARVLTQRGVLARNHDDLPGARVQLEEALRLTEAGRAELLRTGIRGFLASILLTLRHHAASLAECRALLATFRAHEARSAAATMVGLLGVNLYLSGQAAEAEAPLTESIVLAAEAGLVRLQGQSQLHRARARWLVGRFADALDDAREAVAIDRAAGAPVEEVFATVTVADALRELGDLPAALEAGAAARELGVELGIPRVVTQAAESLALTRLRAGDLAAAAAEARSGLMDGIPAGRRSRLLLWSGVAALLAGDAEGALAGLDEALSACTPDDPDRVPEGSALAWRGATLWSLGRDGAADLDRGGRLLAPAWHPPSTAAAEILAGRDPGGPPFTEALLARSFERRPTLR